MTRIKFRSWDWRSNTIKAGIDYSLVGLDTVWLADPLGVLNTTYQGRKIFTQWTGLKDINGVEVYFGDICAYHDHSGRKRSGVVKTYDYFGGYIEAFGGDDEGNQDIELHPDYKIEVIGNIYETPELLKNPNLKL